MRLIDTHCHLDEGAFLQDADEVITRAVESGLEAMITVGTTAASSRLCVELAEEYPAVFAAVGIQPNYVAEAQAGDWDTIEELVRHPKVVAIGETGLDRYWDFTPLELQREFFFRHIELARECGLPFIVHCREAEADVVAVLREAAAAGPLRGVMHSFSGDAATAEVCVDLGLHISFSGMLTYRKNEPLRDLARQTPAGRLLIETDAPYLAPSPNRGKRNEPSFLRYTAARLAEVRGISVDQAATLTADNARSLFELPAVPAVTAE